MDAWRLAQIGRAYGMRISGPATPSGRFLDSAVRRFTREEGGIVFDDLMQQAKAAKIEGMSLVNLLATAKIESNFKTAVESHLYQPETARKLFLALRHESDEAIRALVHRGADAFFETVYGANTSVGKTLGNVLRGDGARYRGRGVFQITGYTNYRDFARASGIDVITHPELLVTDAKTSNEAAIWFWKSKVVAMGAAGDIVKATKIVNPRLVGLNDRIAASKQYAQFYA